MPLLGLLGDRQGLDNAFVVTALGLCRTQPARRPRLGIQRNTSRDPVKPPMNDELSALNPPLADTDTPEVAVTQVSPYDRPANLTTCRGDR
jgi:hypothetical protein